MTVSKIWPFSPPATFSQRFSLEKSSMEAKICTASGSLNFDKCSNRRNSLRLLRLLWCWRKCSDKSSRATLCPATWHAQIAALKFQASWGFADWKWNSALSQRCPAPKARSKLRSLMISQLSSSSLPFWAFLWFSSGFRVQSSWVSLKRWIARCHCIAFAKAERAVETPEGSASVCLDNKESVACHSEEMAQARMAASQAFWSMAVPRNLKDASQAWLRLQASTTAVMWDSLGSGRVAIIAMACSHWWATCNAVNTAIAQSEVMMDWWLACWSYVKSRSKALCHWKRLPHETMVAFKDVGVASTLRRCMVLRMDRQWLQAVASATANRVTPCPAEEAICFIRNSAARSHCTPLPKALMVASAAWSEPGISLKLFQSWSACGQLLWAPASAMRRADWTLDTLGRLEDAFLISRRLPKVLQFLHLNGENMPQMPQPLLQCGEPLSHNWPWLWRANQGQGCQI